MGTLFGQVGGRQVHGDALGRQGQRQGRHRGTDPVAGFADRFVRQTDQRKGGQASGDSAFHLDQAGLYAHEGDGVGAGDQGSDGRSVTHG